MLKGHPSMLCQLLLRGENSQHAKSDGSNLLLPFSSTSFLTLWLIYQKSCPPSLLLCFYGSRKKGHIFLSKNLQILVQNIMCLFYLFLLLLLFCSCFGTLGKPFFLWWKSKNTLCVPEAHKCFCRVLAMESVHQKRMFRNEIWILQEHITLVECK